MTTRHKAIALSTALLVILILGFATRAQSTVSREPLHVEQKPTLDHAQLVWSYALEWCESHGVPGAINPKDRDGTPSYGGYQFKPGTLNAYAKEYGVEASSSVMDYAEQRATLEAMILHEKQIDWHQQFPDCVKRLGLPPA